MPTRSVEPPSVAGGSRLPPTRSRPGWEAPAAPAAAEGADPAARLRRAARLGHRVPGLGQPLEARLRRRLETAAGEDLSTVRVERIPATDEAAPAVTRGERIRIAAGAPGPESEDGRQLLAHEVAHVVQQRRGRVRTTGSLSGRPINEEPELERQADLFAERAAVAGGSPAAAPAPPLAATAPAATPLTAPAQGFGGLGRGLRRFGGWIGGGLRRLAGWAAGVPGRIGRAVQGLVGRGGRGGRSGRGGPPRVERPPVELEPLVARPLSSARREVEASPHRDDEEEVKSPLPPLATSTSTVSEREQKLPETYFPSYEELQRMHETGGERHRSSRRDPNNNNNNNNERDPSGGEPRPDFRALALDLYSKKSGHGRKAHASKVINRPEDEVARSREKDIQTIADKLEEQWTNRQKKDKRS